MSQHETEQIVGRGVNASRLLEDELLLEVIKTTRDQAMEDSLTADTVEEREKARAVALGMDELVLNLRIVQDRGEQARRKLL